MPGPVQGAQGALYSNRTDLNAQPVRTATGQPYGAAGEQAASQRAVPLPQGERALPTPLGAPSSRPDEPLTAGVPFGPGRATKAINGPQGDDPTLDQLRVLYSVWPSEDLRVLIERVERTGQ